MGIVGRRLGMAVGLGVFAVSAMAASCGTTTGGAPANSHKGPVSVSVTGSGNAQTVDIIDGSQQTQHNGIALPYNATITDNPAMVGVTAQSQSGSPSSSISCEIDMPGQNPVKNTSTGAYAVVDCNANSL